jgi:ribonuclease P protein subunit POP4
MITKENLLAHEIIGLNATIEKCSDRCVNNLSGRIILETKNMISIETDHGIKQIPKDAAKRIRFDLGSGSSCCVAGSSLIGRPQDRLSRIRIRTRT